MPRSATSSARPAGTAAPAHFDFDGIGTSWQIETPRELDPGTRRLVLDRVEEFDRTYSRFRADSLVTAVAERPGTHLFPPDSIGLFDLYDRLVAATDGAVDPLVGRELELLGYDASYRLRPAGAAERAAAEASGPAGWAADVERDGRRLTTERPVVIDVGAAGKGYLVDLVAELLRGRGYDEFLVDASGDLVHSGREPIRVALEHPLQPGTAIGVAEVADASLCASASNRRVWGDGLHHILDARTGSPAREVIATWVVAADTALADGLATALFFTGAHRLAETFHFSYVRMYADGRAERSRDFRGELFS
ncbi:FAD:protein FMN transferase [Herbiconiux daphne]|uniref:FAD:protein FMN transferase n=1 Tax=Herbiconiux daphne TaxID=2970914 RepID=A0ABT2GXU5_9MICO|nr:FAD:protein FMN transferase [Herbiconiux daphne]MCS5732147.1 FAD:protein FMN transferase [Herbiconiux daphne]